MKTYNIKEIKTTNLSSIIEELKTRVTITEVVDKLNLSLLLNLQKTGNELQGDCPTGHPSANHKCFSIDTDENLYHCFSCGESGNVVQLVALVNNTGIYQATRWVVDNLAPDLSEKFQEFEDGLTEEQKEFHQRSYLYELIYQEGKRLLYEPIGQTIIDYLVNQRGYDKALLPKTEFIFWDQDQNIRQFLKTKAPHFSEQIDKLNLQGAFGDHFRLAIPYRNRNGMITGFMKRAHQPKGFTINGKPDIRWDSTPGLEKTDIFGLHRIRKEDTLIIVEGYPDAAYFPALGISNIVALGQGAFSENYLEGFQSKKIKRIILALDNDDTGFKNSEAICTRFADSDIEVFIIDPASLSPHKDPDEYVKAKAQPTFQSLINNASSGPKWMVKRMISKYNISLDLYRRKAIDAVMVYADSLRSPLACKEALDEMVVALNLSPELLETEFKRVQEQGAAQRLQEGVSNLDREIKQLIAAGKYDEAADRIAEQPTELLSEFRSQHQSVEITLADFLKEKQAKDYSRIPGERLGYEFKTLSDIDAVLSGLQSGLYIIGADPNVGKTALMVSMSIDLLDSNPDAAILFFTMDDGRDTIISRFLAGKTQMEINQVQCKPDPANEVLMSDGYRWISDKAISNQLDIKETQESFSMSMLEGYVRNHPRREKLIVFIDGLYNVPMERSFSSIREENIERANRIKQLVKLYNIPMIATAEFRKRTNEDASKKARSIHDLMETSKYGYNADVVWLLTPQNQADYKKLPEPIIEMEFAKNKLSSYRDAMQLTFVRAKSIMKPLVSLTGPTIVKPLVSLTGPTIQKGAE